MITQYKIKAVKVCEEPGEYITDNAEKALEFWNEKIITKDFFDEEKEHLVVLVLNTKLKIKGYNLVSIGSLNESLAHPREIFRPVIALSGYGFILMHNHPSGDPAPSQADHRLTKSLREAASILQIQFLDHVIAGKAMDGNSGYFSFREAGCL